MTVRVGPRVNYLQQLVRMIEAHELPAPDTECHFRPHPGQKNPYRWDLCWNDAKVAVEYQGIVGARHGHSDVGHRSLSGMQRDYEKLNEGQLHGWHVLFVTAITVDDGKAIDWIKRALARRASIATLNAADIGRLVAAALGVLADARNTDDDEWCMVGDAALKELDAAYTPWQVQLNGDDA